MKIRASFAVAGALLTFACSSPGTGSSESAIIGGDADTTTTGVVMLYIEGANPNSGWADCSGTVVSPHVVVTAAHCLDPSVIGLGPSPVFQVYLGDDIYAVSPPSDFHAVSQTIMDPAFSNTTLATTGHDIGIVVTTDPLPVPPIAFARTPLDASLIGQPARLVGFGLTSVADANSDGRRNSGSTTIATLDALQMTTTDALPSGCEGDSGGALLVTLAGVETLVGVISHGVVSEDCHGSSTAERVDVADSLIEPAIQESDPGFLPSSADASDASDSDGDDASPPPTPAVAQGSCSIASGPSAMGGCWLALFVAMLIVARSTTRRSARLRPGIIGRWRSRLHA